MRATGSLHVAGASIHHIRIFTKRWCAYPRRVDEAQEDALVETYLASLAPEALRARLTAIAATYEPLRLRLLTEAQAANGAVDVAALKKELTALMRVSTRHEWWGGSREYADESQTAIDIVAGVLDAGAADAAIVLAEHLLKRFETALGRLDDSGGYLAWPIEQVGDLHHAACVAAQPDPRKLATRLFEFAMKSDWEFFIEAPEGYADVLGEDGLATYRALLERAAERLPRRAAHDDRLSDPAWPSRFRVAHMRESLARAAGSVDELVAVMSEDLASPYAYLRIAEVLDAAGRQREALGWLERSIASFGPNADGRVCDATLDAYLRDGQDADALELARRAFDEEATAETYAILRRVGLATGGWPDDRPAALERLRTRPDGWHRSGRTEAVVAQLAEGELDGAWADASAEGCRPDVWLQLADASQTARPDDAVAVYRHRVDELLDGTKHYGDAVKVLRQWHATLKRAGRVAELRPELDRIREKNARRPKFLEKLDRAKLDTGPIA